MKKLMSIVAFGLLASVALAAPGFDILGTEPIEIPLGGTTDVYIAMNGTGTVGGMELYLQSSMNVGVVGIQAANVSGGFFTSPGNTASETVYLFPNLDVPVTQQMGVCFLSTTGDIAVTSGNTGLKVAKVTLLGLTPGLGLLQTGIPDFGAVSNFAKGDANGQDMAALKVLPEPVSGLLLLAGLPLLRRRRA